MYAIRDKESGSLYCLNVEGDGHEDDPYSVFAELWLLGVAPWLTDSLDDARRVMTGKPCSVDCPRLSAERMAGAEVVMVEVTVIAS